MQLMNVQFSYREEYQGKLLFQFNAVERLSKVFNLMEALKQEHSIESYAITNQNSLLSIFLDYVQNDVQ